MDEVPVMFQRIGPSHLQTAVGAQEEPPGIWFQTCLFPTDGDNVDLVNSILSTIGGHYVTGNINNIALRWIGVGWQLRGQEVRQPLVELNQNRVVELDSIRHRLRTALTLMRLRGFIDRFHISYEHIPPPAVNN
ncbi:hypothetical protein BCON_0016g00850 [Botryotinia convoluta]|uniref:Uncharacterized protein n=1 Tax=Botryotinia convoluta TaxID=54673 RepID=A0A4Z1ITY5_9HELO|nr:hypothetical protein BCON_0016g00850 [Botryotinia convoluta]